MASCLLKNLDDFDKADMQSAVVLLGLMPTFLQYIGPTLGELDFITRRRPLLAFLMVVGAPVMSVRSRLFKSASVGESLRFYKIFGYKNMLFKAAFILIQYGCLALCIRNSLQTSMEVGQKTILSWNCTETSMQLWWNLMPIIPFSFHISALWCSKVSGRHLLCVFMSPKDSSSPSLDCTDKKEYLY